ncbi:MAG: hypothetical protein JXQ75_06050 [Phycisphaerae bacterium]|nr:hypothetical protein [Phycisphaerae bacterium]
MLPLCTCAIVAAAIEVAKLVPSVAESAKNLKWAHLSSVLDSFKRLATRFLRQIVPLLECWLFDRKHTPVLLAAARSAELDEAHRGYLDVGLEELQESHELEMRRRAAVQQRVQGNAATIAVVTGLLAAGLALLKDDLFKQPDAPANLFRVILTAVVVWLVMSGSCAIRAIGVNRQYDRWLQTREPGSAVAGHDEVEKAKLVKMILLNQGYTLIVTNYAMASHISMRNAFVAMGVLVITILWLH